MSGNDHTRRVAYIVLLRFILLIMVLVVVVIIILIVVFLELALEFVVVQLFKGKSIACEPVDRAGNEFLLDVLAKLVVQLETLFDVRRSIVVFCRGLRRGEEVEE